MTIHEFARRMAYADRPEIMERVVEILVRDLGASRVERAGRVDDLRGVDYWAYLSTGRPQGVDLKARRREWGDLYLELVSRDDDEAPGWTVDQKKITDYVLFLWPQTYLLLPFPQLRATVRRNEAAYRERYGTSWASSEGRSGRRWRTENLALPAGLVFRDMFGCPAPIGVPLSGPRSCPSCHEEHPIGTPCGYMDDPAADTWWKSIEDAGL